MTADYLIPAEEFRREITVVNSRFIASLAPVFTTNEARAFIANIRREFGDANHNVPIYILGGGNNVVEYCNDDGEPSGTAGRPALAVLRGSGLGDAALVVTRYFGGTLLGKGGLVKAYTEAAQSVVRAVPRARKQQVHLVRLSMPYNLLERVRMLVERKGGEILDEAFTAKVSLSFHLPVAELGGFQVTLQELSAGKLQAEIIETSTRLVPVNL